MAEAFRAVVLTLFPDAFPGVLGLGLTGRALAEGLWSLDVLDIRGFATDRHRTVDDTPAGGGPGMVMRPDVVAAAVDAAQAARPGGARWPVIYLSPRGASADSRTRCGDRGRRGRDAALRPLRGRRPAGCWRRAGSRRSRSATMCSPGVSRRRWSCSTRWSGCARACSATRPRRWRRVSRGGLLEHPHYTRPAVWEGREVPEVLLSGHHARVAEWRRAQSLAITRDRRPDLWAAHLRGVAGQAPEQSNAQSARRVENEKEKDR